MSIFFKTSSRYIQDIMSYIKYNYYYDNDYRIAFTHTFILNNYRIFLIFYKKYICIIAKDIYNKNIYTGYITNTMLVTSNKTGGISGLDHYVPIIKLNRLWDYNSLIDYIIYELYTLYNINIPLLKLKLYIDMTNFNYDIINDDNHGLTEYEYNYDKWVNLELK